MDPAQIEPEGLAAITILATTFGFTVIVIPVDVAGFPDVQVRLDVRTHVTISPFTNKILVYVVELVPTFVPFNFH